MSSNRLTLSGVLSLASTWGLTLMAQEADSLVGMTWDQADNYCRQVSIAFFLQRLEEAQEAEQAKQDAKRDNVTQEKSPYFQAMEGQGGA